MFMCKYVLGFIMFSFQSKVYEFVLLNDFIARSIGSVLTLDIVKELYFLQITTFHLLEKQLVIHFF